MNMKAGDDVVFEAADGTGPLRARVMGATATEAGVPLYELSVEDPSADTEHRRRFSTWAKEGDGPGRVKLHGPHGQEG